jgi:hypothetical protein
MKLGSISEQEVGLKLLRSLLFKAKHRPLTGLSLHPESGYAGMKI